MNNTLVTGGTGMVGLALQRLIPEAIFISSKQYDLRKNKDVERMFSYYEPEQVIHLAARVGGIKANMDYMADFYLDNILINTNVLQNAHRYKTKKLVSLLSTCVYPDNSKYPLTEDQVHNGIPHSTNFAYAHAKRMLDVQSRAYRKQYGCNFITAIPNNLFGENDNFDLENSHVIPAIIRKIHEAKQIGSDVALWGNGRPKREFTYSMDLAEVLLFLLEHYDNPEPINVGNTGEHSIKDIATTISDILQFDGEIKWDRNKPSGQYRKPSDNSKLLELGWHQENYSNLRESLKNVCEWFIINYPNIRGIG
tara:strand:- start:868 stop:1794 length:927 start_codon:yes stop_codon:yes gene_type:complete